MDWTKEALTFLLECKLARGDVQEIERARQLLGCRDKTSGVTLEEKSSKQAAGDAARTAPEPAKIAETSGTGQGASASPEPTGKLEPSRPGSGGSPDGASSAGPGGQAPKTVQIGPTSVAIKAGSKLKI